MKQPQTTSEYLLKQTYEVYLSEFGDGYSEESFIDFVASFLNLGKAHGIGAHGMLGFYKKKTNSWKKTIKTISTSELK